MRGLLGYWVSNSNSPSKVNEVSLQTRYLAGTDLWYCCWDGNIFRDQQVTQQDKDSNSNNRLVHSWSEAHKIFLRQLSYAQYTQLKAPKSPTKCNHLWYFICDECDQEIEDMNRIAINTCLQRSIYMW